MYYGGVSLACVSVDVELSCFFLFLFCVFMLVAEIGIVQFLKKQLFVVLWLCCVFLCCVVLFYSVFFLY